MQIKSILTMMTHSQGRSRLRISDQDALLKWCRSNGFSLSQLSTDSPLTFDINRRGTAEESRKTADFVLTASAHNFSVRDTEGHAVAQGVQLRDVLKQVSNHLANMHSAAS